MAQSFLILCFILTHFIAIATSLNDQGLALLSFKQSLQNQNNSVFANWNSSDPNPCSWQGITCNDDLRVVSIRLPNKRLLGSLHPSIGSLLSLRHINLRDNEFHGKLPVELFGPKGIQSLVLSGNSFTGSVPEEVGILKSLMTLDLSDNSFYGSIPLSLIQCKRLKTLVLSKNSFTGDLPTAFGANLVHLRTLNLSFNRLTGTIPKDLGSLRNLKGTLDLSHNFFSGMIPTSLGDLSELLYVDLSYNNLSGPIPKSNVLLNAGPNAFQGNSFLCGLPLKVSCATRNTGIVPSQLYTKRANHHSRLCIILTAIAGTVAGIVFIASLFIYYLRKASAPATKDDSEEKLKKTKPEFFCFKTENSESEALDEKKTHQQVFIPMDPEIEFDLDQLLKASAFLLGKSRIGLVYKVVLENGLMLAVRRLEDKGCWLRLKEFLADVEAMAKLKHPNILNLKACCWSPEEKLLIYDYIPNGDLGSAIQGRAGSVSCKQLTWPVRLRILRRIAKGLTYIHDFSPKRYVHGHITSSNILLGPNLEPKISGFGLGRIVNPSSEVRSDQISPTETSSPIVSRESYYQAPEASSRMTKPSQKWDVYSFGLVILELVTGKSPVNSEMDLVMWVESASERNKPVWYVLDPVLARDRDLEDSMVQVIKIGLACVHKNPDKRPLMRNIYDSFEKLGSTV
ncbi:PREDICTED: probable inactive leucine-rich repeat receptor-like protein kinase At1g66830 [Camelina sativa]|uniref:Probable inactive leucine-rich repeat receptor-like protein kinase At1g66830 n=1 Tax=Camelina sativa TaxID=90675 RepID=A0ABM0Z7P9_CAMSA|nr:PREDICTED: probable inactive leucine-rich repeat receptor-like protein kinase At1g66830 [Camelina sativa]